MMHYAATSPLDTDTTKMLLLLEEPEEPLAVVGALRFSTSSSSSIMKNRFGKFLVQSKMSLVFMLSPIGELSGEKK